MVINHDDGQFGLDCWLSERDESDPKSVYSDNVSELEAEADRLVALGHFQYLELSRWDAIQDDWVLIRSYEP